MKYFAKYLPVECDFELKHGDKFFIEDKIFTFRNEQMRAATEDFKFCKKAKLFICSREIEVGDKFNSANGANFICSRVDDEKVYSIGGLKSEIEEVPHSKNYSYKIIGEVSAEATWVNEGDQFNITDLAIPSSEDEPCNYHELALVMQLQNKEPFCTYLIKGCCGRFH